MKDEMKAMFDKVSMPEAAQRRILAAVNAPPRRKTRPLFRTLAAVSVMLALVIFISPTARAAMEAWAVKYFFPGSDITIYEKTDVNGNVVAIAGVDTEAPPFARMVNDRLYFVGNNEKIDITDEVTEDSPYYYIYEDDYGLTHAMAVGCSGSLENYGIYEFIWEEQDGQRDWITGTGRNFMNSETGTRYPWVEIVWVDLDIPWPMPE